MSKPQPESRGRLSRRTDLLRQQQAAVQRRRQQAVIQEVLARLHGILHITKEGHFEHPAVNGAAAGAGAPLALHADFVIAGENAFFYFAFPNVGLALEQRAGFEARPEKWW